MTAKIGLKQVILHAPHGYFEEEHLMGNTFAIDVEVDAQIGGAAQEDDLGQTVNYATIYYLLKAEMKKPTQLLEALAYRMAQRIADQFDNVTGVRLTLHKMNPPLGGKVGSSYVSVEVAASSGYGMSDINRPRTFEETHDPRFDADGPFAGSGNGGRVSPPRPKISLPPPSLPPVMPTLGFADEDDDFEFTEAPDFDDEGLFDHVFEEEDLEPHAVSDTADPLEAFDLPEEFDEADFDFDPNDLGDLGDFSFDFDDLDLPDLPKD